MDGILNVNKPTGQTSYSVVAQVKLWSGEKRVGHAGTLDPMATGVLPICLGQATRIVEYLVDTRKTYLAEMELGLSSDTYDAAGNVLRQSDASLVTLQQFEATLSTFRGAISQVPPPFSATKYHGQPLYQWARAGVTVTKEPRTALIFELAVLDWRPPLVNLKVVCGKGTYIRSLANDLGRQLGCGAILKSLARTRTGIFDIADAATLPRLAEVFGNGTWSTLLYPIDSVLQHWPAVVLDEAGTQKIRFGLALEATVRETPNAHCRAYAASGEFLAVLRYDAVCNAWRPEKVFHRVAQDP